MHDKSQYGLPSQEAPISKRAWWYPPFIIVLLIGASCFITQRVAAAYGYHAALGQPITGHFYAPWAWYLWWTHFPDTAGVFEQAINLGLASFVIPQIMVLAVLLAFNHKPKANANLHGSARWANKIEITKTGLLTGKGVYVGGWQEKDVLHYLRHNGPEHILVFAPTRSGKGVGIVLPNLLSWPDSALILDIKGENWAFTAGWRKSQGHKVFRFDPADVSLTGAAFNPLEEIRINSPHAIADAQNVGMMIVDPDGQGLKDYWNKAAFAFFSGAVLHCCLCTLEKHQRPATLSDLGYMLSDINKNIREVFEEMMETDHDALLKSIYGDAVDPFLLPDQETGQGILFRFIASSTRELLNKADSELSGVVSTAIANVSLYRDPIITANTARCDFKLSDLMNLDAPVSVYLVFSPNDISRLRPLIRLFVSLLIGRITAKMEFENGKTKITYKHRLLLLMDELTSLGRLDIFATALAYLAGYGIKVLIIVQDMTQLTEAYGKDESIMSNCHVRIAYAPNKLETAKLLSDLTGKTTVIEQKTSLSGARAGHLKNASVSLTETARPLLTPDECMRLPGIVVEGTKALQGGDMLIFMAGTYPIYGRQILFFLDPVFAQRSKILAPDQSDRLGATMLKLGDKIDKMECDLYAQALAFVVSK